MYQGQYITIDNFGGGLATQKALDTIPTNQAQDLDNIVVLPGGKGFRSRYGTVKINNGSSTLAGAFSGLAYFRPSGVNKLVMVAGVQIYSNTYTPGITFTDITGAVTVNNSTESSWDIFEFNGELIAFGGGVTSAAPNAPWKWTGSGNAAALGGSPPSAYGGFSANNRVFGYRTATDSSTIYWSIIGNAEDWTGAGSGSAVVGSLADDEPLTGAALTTTNTAYLFKQQSIYQMALTEAPFPIYIFNDSVGAVNKHAITEANGVIYFLSPDFRLRRIVGARVEELPINYRLFSSDMNLERLRVFRQYGLDYDWIVVSGITQDGGTTYNVQAAVWDLLNNCWLKCSTGYEGLREFLNVGVFVGFNTNPIRFYGGSDGRLYSVANDSAVYTDSYNDASTTYTAFWQSGWFTPKIAEQIVQVSRVNLNLLYQSTGSVTLTYGYNFIAGSGSTTISQVRSSTQQMLSNQATLVGRGNYFQYKLAYSHATTGMEIYSLVFAGKTYGQKKLAAS